MPEITPQQIEAARQALADSLQQRDTLLQQRAASQAVAASAARRFPPDDQHLRELNNAAEQADRDWQHPTVPLPPGRPRCRTWWHSMSAKPEMVTSGH